MMKTKKYISLSILHVVFWTVILMMSSILMISLSPGNMGIKGNPFQIRWAFFFTLLTGTMAFYMVSYVNKKLRNKTFLKISLLFVLVLILSVLYFFSVFSLYKTGSPETFFASGPKMPPYLAFFSIVFFSVMGLAFESYGYSMEQREKEYKLKEEKWDIELVLIKKQLSPHFLFNTLNNIDNFIYQDKAKASEAIIRLSSILRYQLYESDKDMVPLSVDMKVLEDYVELQKMRYGNPNIVRFRKGLEASDHFIAPALFIPFIENAFKFSPLNNNERVIEFNIETSNNILFLKIENLKREGIAKTEHSGMGVKLTQKRLDLLYPEKHHLKLTETETSYTVELKLELNEI